MRIAADILYSVVRIALPDPSGPSGSSDASALVVRRGSQVHLVTARHVLSDVADLKGTARLETIAILGPGPEPLIIPIAGVRLGEGKLDVAILELAAALPLAMHPVAIGDEGPSFWPGQDALVVGFSGARLPGDMPRDPDGYALPLVRRGIVSAIRPFEDGSILLLDTGSVAGLSGGLVLVGDDEGHWHPAAMNAGCVIDRLPVIGSNAPEDLWVRANNGLAYAFGLKIIANLLDR